MEKRTVLLLIDWFLPGTKSGGPVRSYTNMIDYLGDYFNFKIITRDTDYCSDEPYSEVTPNTWNVYNSHASVYYMSKEQRTTNHLKQLLKDTAYDVLYINGMYSWYFSILPLLLRDGRQNTIVAPRGMLNTQAFSVKPLRKKLFLKLAKWYNLYKKLTFHATNIDESNHIKALLGNQSDVKIAPNFPRRITIGTDHNTAKHQPVRIVSVGRISIEKGTLHLIQALSTVKEAVRLDIYGPIYDQAYWEQCVAKIEGLPHHCEVEYKGSVDSETIPELLKQYDFFALLSEGENFGHAILEALSAGCPVIISNRTPWKNLEVQHIGWDVEVSDTNEINRIFNEALGMTDEAYATWSKNAMQYALRFAENPEVLASNLRLFQTTSS